MSHFLHWKRCYNTCSDYVSYKIYFTKAFRKSILYPRRRGCCRTTPRWESLALHMLYFVLCIMTTVSLIVPEMTDGCFLVRNPSWFVSLCFYESSWIPVIPAVLFPPVITTSVSAERMIAWAHLSFSLSVKTLETQLEEELFHPAAVSCD